MNDEIEKFLIESTSVPLGVLSRIMNANVIKQELLKQYTLDLSIFLKHYKITIAFDELEGKNKDKIHTLVRSRWLDCINNFHGDIQKIDKKTKNEPETD